MAVSDDARFGWLETQIAALGQTVEELKMSIGEMREYAVGLEYKIAKTQASASGNPEILERLISLQEYLKKSSKAQGMALQQGAATYRNVIEKS